MRRATRRTLGAVALVLAVAGDGWADPLDDLAREFWTWRAVQQPLSHDDIPRIERPVDWVPDWSSATVNRRRQELAAFDARWKAIDARAFPVPRQVDYRLMGSALARVRWELDILRGWRRNPVFYVAQTIGGIFEALLPPPPFDEVRSRQVLLRMRSIPATVAAATQNLDEAERPFAELGIAQLKDVSGTLTAVAKAAAPLLAPTVARELPEATTRAIAALEAYRDWLQQRLAGMRAGTPVGREQYVWFLSNVALVPYTPEALLAMGRQEWERAAAFETYERNRNHGLPELPIFPSVDAHLKKQAEDEEAVRRFIVEKRLLTIPPWVKHYRNLLLPGVSRAAHGDGRDR